MPNKNLLNIKS